MMKLPSIRQDPTKTNNEHHPCTENTLEEDIILTENNIITLITHNKSMQKLKFVQGGNIFSGKFECDERRRGERIKERKYKTRAYFCELREP